MVRDRARSQLGLQPGLQVGPPLISGLVSPASGFRSSYFQAYGPASSLLFLKCSVRLLRLQAVGLGMGSSHVWGSVSSDIAIFDLARPDGVGDVARPRHGGNGGGAGSP